MKLESIPTIIDFNPYETRTEAESTHSLGAEIVLSDGRRFRHAKAGASNISKGKLQLAPAQKANHHNIAVAAAVAAGATQVTLTLGATAAVADEYNEGYLAINDNAGEGQTYKISRSSVAASSGVITVDLFSPVNVALATTSEATLVHNTYNAVVEGTVATRRAAGVPLISLTAGDFGWVQSRGTAAVLNGAAVTAGASLMADASTAGAVTDQTDVTAPQAEVCVGRASILAGVATEYRPIVLTID